jgi:hypothetical protein
MVDLCVLVWSVVAGLFRSRVALHAEILVLRHQINVLRRNSPKRLVLSNIDRLAFTWLCDLAPSAQPRIDHCRPTGLGALAMQNAYPGRSSRRMRMPQKSGCSATGVP